VLTLTTISGGNLLTLGLALDLNLASREDLEALPGIGPVLARRIADFREKHGPFRDISELEQVTGVGPGKLAKLRPHVTVSRIGTDQEKQEE
jgi:competence protein ComEA